MSISKDFLIKKYIQEKKSVKQIADLLNCSETKVNYWLKKYDIQKRKVSEAVYVKLNPQGDPFKITKFNLDKKSFLFGIGLGLFWGEGNKVNKNSLRLGNSDPYLIKIFLKFLENSFSIQKTKLSFGIQIFSDCSKEEALNYWMKCLNYPISQFQKVVVTPSRAPGTYRNKTKYGVLTIYFNNTKLRNHIMQEIENLKKL